MNTHTLAHTLVRIMLVAVVALMVASCKTPTNVVYLQDIQPNISMALQEERAIRLQPGDRLSIIIHSKNSEMVEMFNLSTKNLSGSNGVSLYTVDASGKIDMPVLGLIDVEGLTRTEVADLVKYRLLSANLLRDPIVIVEYAQMGYYVMGEVNAPGRIEIDKDRINILEALISAGDLTINGQRENILVLRTENGVQVPYRINLTETRSVYASPAFYVQQNDIIYVEPNEQRISESTVSVNITRTPSFWVSMGTFLMSLILFLNK